MNILDSLPKAKTGSEFIVVMTDGYPRLTRTIQPKKTTAMDVALIFVEESAVPYGIPDRLLTDNAAQLAEKLFRAVCVGLRTKPMTTTAYQPRTSVQTERYSKTIFSRFCHYINNHQNDDDTLV